MITFLTLLAGLVAGAQSFEIAVSGPVARAELRLNGRPVDEAQGPPWTLRCDLGRELLPGHLEVVAFDADGRQLGRDEQWFNLPERRAEAAIVPVVDETGRVVAVDLTWTSPEFDRPRSIVATLDGVPVPVSRSRRIELPELAADELHELTVDFRFPAGVTVKRQLTFGKGFAGDAVSGLTAVPVLLDGLDELPPVDQLDGWLAVDGTAVAAAAVERGGGRLVIVRDPEAEEVLVGLLEERRRAAKRGGRGGDSDGLADDVEIRVLVAEPKAPRDRARATLLFPYSERGLPGPEGILAAATAPKKRRLLGQGLMLGDAVAIAGLRAAEGNLRRAVLLLLGPEREDFSRFDPPQVRRFLHDLHVPLVVWDASGPAAGAPEAWEAGREVRTVDDVIRATRRLRALMDRQRIVWVAGNHLPQSMSLGPRAEGVELVR